MRIPRIAGGVLLWPILLLCGCTWGGTVEPDLPPVIAGVYIYPDWVSDEGPSYGSPAVYAGFTVEPPEWFASGWIEATQTANIAHPTQWRWDFGGAAGPDPFLQETPEPIAFPTPGTFSASVTATNENGSATFPFTFTVLPLGKPRLVMFNVQKDGPDWQQEIGSELVSGQAYVFAGLFAPGPLASPGPAPAVNWDPGSGLTTAGGTDDTHLHAEATEPGTYSGSVTATNSAGSTVHTFDYTVVP